MIEKWKAWTIGGALFIDFSKVFNIPDHALMLAKLSAYGLDNNSLSFGQKDYKDVRVRLTSVAGAK